MFSTMEPGPRWKLYTTLVWFAVAAICLLIGSGLAGCASQPAATSSTAKIVQTAGDTADYMIFWTTR